MNTQQGAEEDIDEEDDSLFSFYILLITKEKGDPMLAMFTWELAALLLSVLIWSVSPVGSVNTPPRDSAR